jgi:hypothetical protein
MSAEERMGGKGPNSELQMAIEEGCPEAYVPDEVVIWLQGLENAVDDLSMIKLGFRFSPKAIRAATLALTNGIYTEEGYFPPPNPQFRQNVAAYAYFNDFISSDEYALLARGKAIYGNMPATESDIWIGPRGRLIGNSVHPTIEEVAVAIDERREQNPAIKVVFFDGKWNGIPHPGYFFLFKETTAQLTWEEHIDPNNLIFVVSCAQDEYIRETESTPFLNTLWRMSLMSYIPGIDYVCASGSYVTTKGQEHWVYKTQVLAPNYISIEDTHPFKERKILQAKAAGARILTHRRAGMYTPIKVGSPELRRLPGPEISSQNLSEGVVGRRQEFSYSNPYAHLFTVKDIYERIYGKRNWFAANQIQLPQDLRRMVAPAEWKIEIPQ